MPSQATLVREQQQAQTGLVVMVLRDMAKVWDLLNAHRLDQSLPTWIAAVHAVTSRYAPLSAALAADYYDSERLAAKAPGRFATELADPPDEKAVDAAMRWATKDLWSRNPETMPEHLRKSKQRSATAAAKLVQDVGRLTVTSAVAADQAARGWVRTASLNACAFCRMLAQRGPVYGAETVRFRSHNDCHCMAQPVFEGQEWHPLPHVKEWQRQYKQAAGMPGDTLKNLRLIVAGRA